MTKNILSILNNLDTRGRIVFSSIVISAFIVIFYSPIFTLIFLSIHEIKSLYIDKIKIFHNQLEKNLIIDFDFNFYLNGITNSVNIFEKDTKYEILQKSFDASNNSIEFIYQNNKVYRIELNLKNILDNKETNSLYFYQFVFYIEVNSNNELGLATNIDDGDSSNNHYQIILNDSNNNYYEYKLKQLWNSKLLLDVIFNFFKHYNVITLFFLLLTILSLTFWSLFFNNITVNNFIFIYLNPTVALLITTNLLNFLSSVLFNYINYNYLLIVYIFLGLFFFFLSYISLLSSSVLLGSTFMNLPLAGVGKTVYFILSIFTVYVYIVYIFLDVSSSLLFKIFILAILTLYYSYALVFLFSINYGFKNININNVIYKSVLNMFFIVIIFVILLFFPTYEVYKVVMISSIFYILISISLEQNKMKNNNNGFIIFEYMIIFLLTLFSLLISSVWGILGSIL